MKYKVEPRGITINELERIFANPMYCLPYVEGWETKDRKTIVDRDTWIVTAQKSMNEMGAEKWLNLLLDNLEGKYI